MSTMVGIWQKREKSGLKFKGFLTRTSSSDPLKLTALSTVARTTHGGRRAAASEAISVSATLSGSQRASTSRGT